MENFKHFKFRDITLKMSIVIEIKNIVGFLARAFQLEK